MHLPSYNCVLCDLDTEETLQHLFLHCPFAKRRWEFVNLHLPNNAEFPDIVNEMRDNLQTQFFMLAIILLCWAIWTSRNDLIFKGIQPSLQVCKGTFLREIKLLSNRVNSRKSTSL